MLDANDGKSVVNSQAVETLLRVLRILCRGKKLGSSRGMRVGLVASWETAGEVHFSARKSPHHGPKGPGEAARPGSRVPIPQRRRRGSLRPFQAPAAEVPEVLRLRCRHLLDPSHGDPHPRLHW